MAQQRDNSGVLFKNDKKQSNNHPDCKGSTTINGVEYWVSGWWKQGRSGQRFLSLAYTPKNQQGNYGGNQGQPQQQQQQQGGFGGDNQNQNNNMDDVPF